MMGRAAAPARGLMASAAVAFVMIGSTTAFAASCAPGTALLTTAEGRAIPVTVEIADDASERAQGLMGRRTLPPGHGMLFVYETPRPASFWMKDTLIPLDMLFFDAAGRLRHVHPQATPLDLTPIPGAAPGDPDPDRLLVLELGGGEAARLGLAPGVVLTHPAVPQAGAAAPCR